MYERRSACTSDEVLGSDIGFVCFLAQVLQLVQASGTHIHSARGWQTVCALITTTRCGSHALDNSRLCMPLCVRLQTSPFPLLPVTHVHFPMLDCLRLSGLLGTRFLVQGQPAARGGGQGVRSAGAGADTSGPFPQYKCICLHNSLSDTCYVARSLQPAAADKAFEALALATDTNGPVLSLVAYSPCLEAVLVILDRHSKAREAIPADEKTGVEELFLCRSGNVVGAASADCLSHRHI